ncbi:MAG: carbon starvation protein A [Rubinisphaera brasiliensis]|uniref:Carbon starvation protein CstA n=1 Tax=Rubinisphaera brasiliensis (strain ATCC 49424 / DSM 5305 / JCM 21570 / IAM 15109 / NBRC 103401 / IFAM 1448) TaxID=756272 RepID=F0SJV2_RUBBR|nr:carbon starvation protein A [Rubinisphaera brasiliensis]ADY58641.1 carbon starvation protein CstA [Rubinisphaera brasiliensis DSM 5305]MBB03275.1 carbon starvation protein A [Planctomyces sp.]MBR9801750.1 carbon starvation protein A [bacterium]
MLTLAVAVLSFFGFIVAYNTYGRYLSKRLFGLDAGALVPSEELRDNIDFVPTKKSVIFGHHFTSIAGTGPIVGPAIAVFWGWLPALLWVVFGSIFIGAVHDFGAMVVSLRNRGQTVGEVAGRLISPRARLLFLLILFFALTIVLAIFGLVIAIIFKIYPESVLSVWLAMPLAVAIGIWVYKGKGGLLIPSIVALFALYGAVALGVYSMPITLPAAWGDPVIVWTSALMIYCFIASVLPVWLLLQPRDYINSHQLVVALLLLVTGVMVAGATNQIDLRESAPAVSTTVPADAPPIWPFLFITIACGACSGFHCLVSSGTTSKQIACEPDAQYVGYGGMLLEGMLAVLVILCCTAGLGMGVSVNGETLTGLAAWESRYGVGNSWADFKLPQTVGAFVDGGANFLSALGIPIELAVGIIAVLVACFAATTLDTATRLQRYVIQELGNTLHVWPLQNKYIATGVAVACGFTVAMLPGPSGAYGTGGLILWPLFGATNQLLAGLALMVTFFYLWRRGKAVLPVAIPMVIMLAMPAWAMLWQMFNAETGWLWKENYLLFGFGALVMSMQVWMVIEGLFVWQKARGVLEESLPPLENKTVATNMAPTGGH